MLILQLSVGRYTKMQLQFMAESIFQHRTQPASSLSLLSFLAMELSARLSSWYGTAQSPSEYWPLFQVSCTEGFCFLNLRKYTKQHQASNWKRLWQWTHNPALATQLPIVSLLAVVPNAQRKHVSYTHCFNSFLRVPSVGQPWSTASSAWI